LDIFGFFYLFRIFLLNKAKKALRFLSAFAGGSPQKRSVIPL